MPGSWRKQDITVDQLVIFSSFLMFLFLAKRFGQVVQIPSQTEFSVLKSYLQIENVTLLDEALLAADE